MDKFDRQLRLWGSHGQYELETAKVCVIACSDLGTEILKNLALPGLKQLTFIQVKAANDVGGHNRFWNLAEWNVTEIIWDTPKMSHQNFWDGFSLVIVASGKPEIWTTLKNVQVSRMLVCRTLGNRGILSFVSREPHFVIESHRRHKLPDLRLDRPRKKLTQAYQALPREDSELTKLPYAALLFRVKKELIDEKLEVSREALKSKLTALQNRCASAQQATNLVEAQRHSHLLLQNSQVLPENVLHCLQLKDEPCQVNFNKTTKVLIQALATYLKIPYSDEQLPLSGTIPDMESSSEQYNHLRQAYAAAAEEDAAVFRQLVTKESSSIPLDQVNAFCKYAHYIRAVEPLQTLERLEIDSKTCLSAQDITVPANLIAMPTAMSDDNEFQRTDYPTVSFMAGVAAQEAVKILTHQFVPIENLLFYDGESNKVCHFKL
ncbi:LADA_0A07008g1_1 [Lachancea dasiensis]|uniref:LADA_0A07008g1_1 n=1 Tax=Lachancea dasiensis TaxID=1072105 RepID=A0A1G4IQD5_9SACH|nr:LADA_0A07008g1_1 [Lachancea dasiensis]